ncbi:MAG: hypothetical protein SFW66_01615 [Gammaproteobacteria bacterium]|nr:hypothetical protein [Gammaproteobacteria bacterium]
MLIEFGAAEIIGKRHLQQDALFIAEAFDALEEKACDKAIIESFATFIPYFQKRYQEGGSTSLVTLSQKTNDHILQVDVANMGDSLALILLCDAEGHLEELLLLNALHQAANSIEKNRVIKAGGSFQNGYLENYEDGLLEVTRSVGDGSFIYCGLLQEPELHHYTIDVGNRQAYLIQTCDGFSETVLKEIKADSSTEAGRKIYAEKLFEWIKSFLSKEDFQNFNAKKIAAKCVAAAWSSGSKDNVSVFCRKINEQKYLTMLNDGHGKVGEEVAKRAGEEFLSAFSRYVSLQLLDLNSLMVEDKEWCSTEALNTYLSGSSTGFICRQLEFPVSNASPETFSDDDSFNVPLLEKENNDNKDDEEIIVVEKSRCLVM